MKRMFVYVSVTVITCMMVIGCQKRVTKVPEPVQKLAPVAAPAAPPEKVVDTSTFQQANPQIDLQALQNIYFDYDKSVIKPEGESRLTIISKFLMDHASVRILISGNCDERGSAEFNIGLGQRRAKVAKDFLVNLGVPANWLEVTSNGKEKLVVTGCQDDPCYAKNRRDEFTVLQ